MPFKNHKNKMTQNMLGVINIFDEDTLKQKFLYCQENFLKAKEAGEIKLPSIAVSGELVQHKSRLIMYQISDYWEIRRDLVKQFLPEEWVELQGVSSRNYKLK